MKRLQSLFCYSSNGVRSFILSLSKDSRLTRTIKKGGKKLIAIFLILIILSGVALKFWSSRVSAAWFDENYAYRQSVVLTNNNSAQTSPQVQVALDTQTLIAAGKMQSDCDDIRFTDYSGKVLTYWTEYCSNTSGANSLFWVTIPSLATGTTPILVYYGNSSAGNASVFTNYPTGISVGTGKDGDITVSADTNINTADTISGRNCSDTTGGDAVIYTSSAATATGSATITLNQSPSGGCLAVGDEVLIINMQGKTTNNANVGKYEFGRVSTIATNILTINHTLQNYYEGTTQKIVIQRVPNYKSVTLSNSGTDFTPSVWDGTTNFYGGIMAFRANGTVTLNSGTTINADALGYAGGIGGGGGFQSDGGAAGESYDGPSTGRGGSGSSNGETRGGGKSGNGTTASPADGITTGAGGGGGGDGSSNGTSGGGGGGGGGGYAGGGGGGGGSSDAAGGTPSQNSGSGGTGGAAGVAGGGGGGGCFETSGGVNIPGSGGNAGSTGFPAQNCAANGTQGAAGNTASPQSTQGSGGGGGNSTTGAGAGGGGGGFYGTATLSTLFLGSGGGAGANPNIGGAGTAGGAGGGIVFVSASTVSVTGSITASGGTASTPLAGGGTGGSGAGGSVYVQAITDSGTWTSNVTASGGAASSAGIRIAGGGAGGDGRIHVDYTDSSAPTTTPSADTSQLAYAGSASNEEQATEPAAYWKFDEGTGTTANDSTSNANAGTLAGTTLPTWQPSDMCVTGKCLYFDGITSKVTIANTVNSVQTISFWAKPASSSASFIQLTSSVDVRASSGSVTTSAITSPTVYVNGVQSSAITANQWNYITITTSSGITANSITLGKSLQGILNGYLDEVKLYPYVRTAAQIKADYNGKREGIGGGVLGSDSQQVLNQGLVGYWKEDECSGTSIADSSGNSNTGTLNLGATVHTTAGACITQGNTAWYNGASGNNKIGGAINYDGSDDYVQVSDSNSLDVTNLTISAWVNIASTSATQTILEKSTTAGTDGYSLDFSNGKFRFCANGGCASSNNTVSINTSGTATAANGTSVTDTGQSWTTNQWAGYQVTITGGTGRGETRRITSNTATALTVSPNFSPNPAVGSVFAVSTYNHIVVTFDGTTTKFYLNGTADGTSTTVTSVPTNALNLRLGIDSATANGFMGLIDEVRLYNRAMSPVEAAMLYNFGPGPMAEFKMDEGSGTSTKDTSGNGNNGTLTNGPTWTNGKVDKAINFDGVDDYVDSGTSNKLDNLPSVSVSAWIYPISRGSNTSQQIVDKSGSGAPTNGWLFQVANCDNSCGGIPSASTLEFAVAYSGNNLDVVAADNSITFGQWQYVTVTWNGSRPTSSVKIYVNGKEVSYSGSSVAATGTRAVDDDSPNSPPPPTLRIGADESTPEAQDPFKGKMDNVRVYNYVRSQQQIIEDMNGGHPAPGSPIGSPLGYWKFDEGYGLTTGSIHNSGNGGTVLAGAVTNVTQSGMTTNSGSGWTTAGKFGKGFNFEGTAGSSNDLVNMGSDTSIDDMTANPMSLSAWIYPNTIGEGSAGVIMAKNGNATTPSNGWLWQLTSTSNLQFSVDGTTDLVVTSTGNPVTLGAWNYVTLTWDGTFTDATKVHMYVNGKEVMYGTQTNGATRTSDAANNLLIGNNNATGLNNTFDGTIDEVKVFTGQMTADQVKIDYNRGSSQVLGALGNNSTYQSGAANQEYCVPGDATSCAAPIGEWNFEEGRGTTVNDTSGNGNTLTWEGTLGSQWTRGKIGKAGSFNGSNNDAIVNPGSGFNIQTPTLEAWFKTTAAGANSYYPLVSKSTRYYTLFVGNSTGGDVNCGDGVGKVSLMILDTSTLACATSSSTYNDGKWHFAVGTYDGSTIKVYVDGVLAGSRSSSKTLGTANTGFSVGSDFSGYFNGQIDGVRVFNYVRTPAQVAWDYNKGGPVGWWKMNECSGTAIHDSSGNNNTGTWSGTGSGSQTAAGDCNTSGTAWANGKSGKVNYSLNFDGTDDVVRATETSSTDLGATTDSYSLSAWIKTSATYAANGYIIAKDDGSGAYPYILYMDTSQHACFKINDATHTPSICGSVALNDGNWHHVVGIRDLPNGQLHLYVDGNKAATDVSDTTTGTTAVNNDDVSIGNGGTSYTSQDFTGQIDDARIYNYPLTSTQVKQVYNGGAAVRFAPVTGAP